MITRLGQTTVIIQLDINARAILNSLTFVEENKGEQLTWVPELCLGTLQLCAKTLETVKHYC